MASFTMTVDGLGASIRGLEQLAAADSRALMRDLGAEQVQNIKDRVDERKSHTDGTYSASKRAQRDGGTTLEDTGAMLKALKASRATAWEVEIGFGSAAEAQKAVWNQYGTRAFTVGKGKAFPITKNGGSKEVIAWSRKKAATPPRPFFGCSPSDLRKLMDYANEWYRRRAEKGGLKVG